MSSADDDNCEVCGQRLIEVPCPDCGEDDEDCDTCSGYKTIFQCPDEEKHPF